MGAVPCSQPHDFEVFEIFDLPIADDAPFPEQATVDRHIEEACLPAFDVFVGTAYEDSELGITTLEPTRLSWAAGDREVLCSLTSTDGSKMEGSMKDSGL